jgi:hypothetical protein
LLCEPEKILFRRLSVFAGGWTLKTVETVASGDGLPRAARFLADLVKEPAFLGSQILPLLGEARYAEGWYVARRYDAHDGAYSLQVFVWPPGTGIRTTTTPPGEPTPAPWEPA